MSVRKMGHRTEAARRWHPVACCESLLLGIEFVIFGNALEVEQIVEAILVNVQRVDLPSAHALAINTPSHTELCPDRFELPRFVPWRCLECVELCDLFRDLSVGRAGLQRE
eukprot:393948-Prymnesium_polylepis.2